MPSCTPGWRWAGQRARARPKRHGLFARTWHLLPMCLLLSPPARLPEPFAQNTHLTDTCPSAPVASHVGVDERRRLVATIEVARVENREGVALRACVGVGGALRRGSARCGGRARSSGRVVRAAFGGHEPAAVRPAHGARAAAEQSEEAQIEPVSHLPRALSPHATPPHRARSRCAASTALRLQVAWGSGVAAARGRARRTQRGRVRVSPRSRSAPATKLAPRALGRALPAR